MYYLWTQTTGGAGLARDSTKLSCATLVILDSQLIFHWGRPRRAAPCPAAVTTTAPTCFSTSGTTVLNCKKPMFSYILPNFSVISGGRINLVLVIPSWPKAQLPFLILSKERNDSWSYYIPLPRGVWQSLLALLEKRGETSSVRKEIH